MRWKAIPTYVWLMIAAVAIASAPAGMMSRADALPRPGQTGLPYPAGGYIVDSVQGSTIDLRNDQRLVVKPRSITIKASRGGIVLRHTGLRWTGWGTRRAEASAVQINCGGFGTTGCTRTAVKLRLDAQRTYGCEASRRSVKIYQRLSWKGSVGPRWTFPILPSVYC